MKSINSLIIIISFLFSSSFASTNANANASTNANANASTNANANANASTNANTKANKSKNTNANTNAEAPSPKTQISKGADTVVIALRESADSAFKKFKRRAVAQDYYLTYVDDEARVFLTNFYDLSKKMSIQIKTYVKELKSGGSNVVINAKILKLKKVKKNPNHRPVRLRYKKNGEYDAKAWRAFYLYAVGSQKWKHQFIKHEI